MTAVTSCEYAPNKLLNCAGSKTEDVKNGKGSKRQLSKFATAVNLPLSSLS